MKRFILILLIILGNLGCFAQGIVFFEGSFEEALVKCKTENKLLFIDFYASWCGPCKKMSNEVFTDEKVGAYFNERFVCLKINTEENINKDFVKKYKAKSLPTFLFLNSQGKHISRATGAMSKDSFFKLGRVASGDERSFEDEYKDYKSSKKDLGLMQKVLIDAPAFVSVQEGLDRQKWIIRIEKLYKEYIDFKIGPDLINKEDFKIIRTFHKSGERGDKLMEFIIANIDEYMQKVSKGVAAYVLGHHDKVIKALARGGNEDYKKELERIKGDMAKAYSIMPEKKLSAYEQIKFKYDADYLLFSKKDVEGYINMKKTYFDSMGDDLVEFDFGVAAQTIYVSGIENISDSVHRQAIEWIIKALKFPKLSIMNKVNFLTMVGDCHRDLKEFEKAKEYYNQAYMDSLQIKGERTQMYIQYKLKQKLAQLTLLK